MTRSMLVLFLCALILIIGLYVSTVQSSNHARARCLAECQRMCEMIEAGNAQADARAMAHLPGEATAPAPAGRLPASTSAAASAPALRP